MALAASGSLGAAAPTGPDDAPEPTTQQLAASVRVYDLRGSVRPWTLDGSVRRVQVEKVEGADTVVVLDSDILFSFGSDELSPAATALVGELVARAPRNAAISVTGHTDGIGDDASNLELSQRRAAAVAAAATGPRPDLAPAATGLGESTPVASNDTPEGRQANRRVEVRYTR